MCTFLGFDQIGSDHGVGRKIESCAKKMKKLQNREKWKYKMWGMLALIHGVKEQSFPGARDSLPAWNEHTALFFELHPSMTPHRRKISFYKFAKLKAGSWNRLLHQIGYHPLLPRLIKEIFKMPSMFEWLLWHSGNLKVWPTDIPTNLLTRKVPEMGSRCKNLRAPVGANNREGSNVYACQRWSRRLWSGVCQVLRELDLARRRWFAEPPTGAKTPTVV